MSRLTEIAVPTVAAIAIVCGIYKYISLQLSLSYGEIARPRIMFEDVIEVTTHLDPDGHFVGETSRLMVHNPGNSTLEKCLVKIEAITGGDGVRQQIQAGLATEARHRSGLMGRFFLGPGERKIVPLTEHNARSMQTIGRVRVALEGNQEMFLGRVNSYKIELIAMSEVGQPIRKTLEVFVDSNAHVETTWLT